MQEDNPEAVEEKLIFFVPATDDEATRLIKSHSWSCSMCRYLVHERTLNLFLTNHYKHIQLVYVNRNYAYYKKNPLLTPLLNKSSLNKDVINNFHPMVQTALYELHSLAGIGCPK